MRVGLATVCVMLAVAAAGCGGGGSGGSSGYTLSSTKACLQKAGFGAVAVGNDELPGAGGNLRVKLTNKVGLLNPSAPSGGGPENEYVFLVFAKDPAAALATERKALDLALQSFHSRGLLMTRSAAKQGVGLTKNVFYYSAAGPLTKDERTKVGSCLR
jgi:hypothetical protein